MNGIPRCALVVPLLLAVLSFAFFACSAPDARDAEGNLRSGWTRLGQTEAALESGEGYDEIAVRSELGAYDRLQLYVDNHPVYLRDVTVHYTDGTSERFLIRATLPAGSHTHVLHLAGFPRGIDRVVLGFQGAEPPGAGAQEDVADSAANDEPQHSRMAVYGRR